ncbi:unnamed protein product [Closterium sp. Yama58-4]|nr:unnamed protein product [Closterium sp. Yama58-4]
MPGAASIGVTSAAPASSARSASSSCCTKDLIRELGVVEAPTFLFYKRGELLGRYVGSGRGDLVGEILKHQGVPVSS